MKLCIDCKHYTRHKFLPQDPKDGQCARKPIYHPVDGSRNDPFCSLERTHAGTCGPGALHWEPVSFPHRDPNPPAPNDMDTFGHPLKEGT